MAQRISMVSGVAQVQVFGSQKYAVRVQLDPRRAGHARHRHRRGGGRDPERERQPADRHALRRAAGVHRPGERPADRRPRRTARSSSPTANGTPVRLDELGRVIDSVENDKTAAWFVTPDQRASRHARHPAAARDEHRRGRRRGQGAAARRSGSSCRPRSTLDVLFDRSESIRAVGQRREVHAGPDARAGRPGDLPLPAQRLGDDHPQPRAADVDRRHVRGHVPARLQPRQPLADGADAVGRLRRRRRDRHAGEHRPAHGDGRGARSRRRSRARRRSASPSCR